MEGSLHLSWRGLEFIRDESELKRITSGHDSYKRMAPNSLSDFARNSRIFRGEKSFDYFPQRIILVCKKGEQTRAIWAVRPGENGERGIIIAVLEVFFQADKYYRYESENKCFSLDTLLCSQGKRTVTFGFMVFA